MQVIEVSPLAGVGYPRTWSEFSNGFATEQLCQQYLERVRWPRGFVCTRCGVCDPPYRASRGRLMCRACRYQASVCAGTIFDKSRTPLRTWLAAAWHMTNQKQGVSALGLQRVLRLSSYETTWAMLHRLRRAMVRPDCEPLSGPVELDVSYLPLGDRRGVDLSARRKRRSTQVLVGIAVERRGRSGLGCVRLRHLARDSEEYVLPFVLQAVAPGSEVHSDGSAAYRSLNERGYIHLPHVTPGSARQAQRVLPGAHRVASLLQRWILDTHHGAVQPSHLDDYLGEFSFRFNPRRSRSGGLLFYRLLQQAVRTDPVTYNALIRPLRAL